MPFEDLDAFLAPGFELPVRGKTYRVPAPKAREGLYLQAIMDAGESLVVTGGVTKANQTVLSDDEERSAYQLALGSAWEEMVADGLEWPIVKHAGLTALVYWTRGPQQAERTWSLFGGKAPEGPQETDSPDPTSSGTSLTDPSTPAPA